MNVPIRGNLTDIECQLLQSNQVNSIVCIDVTLENRNKVGTYIINLTDFTITVTDFFVSKDKEKECYKYVSSSLQSYGSLSFLCCQPCMSNTI